MPCALAVAVVACFLMLWITLVVVCLYVLLWLLGWKGKLPEPSGDGEKGIGEGLWALAFILTQLIALTASQAGRRPLRDEPTDFRFGILMTFLPLAIVTFGTLVVMIRLKTVDKDGKPKRVYGPGAITFMRWVLVSGVTLALIFVRLAWCGELPTQVTFKTVPLKTIHAQAFVFPNKDNVLTAGTQGIRVDIPITKADFPDGVPGKLFIEVAVGPAVYKTGWRAQHPRLYDGEPESDKRHVPPAETMPYLDDPDSPAARTFEVAIRELKPDLRYTLSVFFWHPIATSRPSFQKIVDLLNDPKQEALTVVAIMKAK